ncbi:isochorismatase family protein [Candidatus Enterococcus clewellii]|uniref:Isochorismatase-like domain-containing protein n=1 Tax=Candidatus Enterococcus clewellii TaxID=1834193 RepID=A0A242K590_9ENTE|nr:isochorismatase family protein [Enterococcus sp. 9E7_DIV0242]OTP14593.1 hypothetical protein A5888_002694 [Enterococcus sp. 9E7_DIV0242]
MLVIIDAQNSNLHAKGATYIGDGQRLIAALVKKTQDALARSEPIIYTRDIPIEHKDGNEDIWDLQIVDELQEILSTGIEVKKHYYGIPPKKMLALKEELSDIDFTKEKIEFIGVETEICVLANLIIFMSTFPEAKFVISKNVVSSRDERKEAQALELFAHWGVAFVN